jgi:hypothetical protein
MAELYQNVKEELIPVFLRFFQEIEREGTLMNSFYKASISLITKPNKDAAKKKRITPQYLYEYRHKNSQQNPGKLNSITHQKDHTL